MEILLRLAVASSLKYKPDLPRINFSVIPSNCFGVFVGIERSAGQAVNPRSNNIHGCIGYWDPKYTVMQPQAIVDQIVKVAYDATWIDRRRNNFKHGLYVDLRAKYKIYFMLEPIIPVDPVTGMLEGNHIFNNREYGLIVEGSARATYLPDVFPNSPWTEIKDSLINKAGSRHGDTDRQADNRFYAYRCQIVTMKLMDYYCVPIIGFINRFYTEFVPHHIRGREVYTDRNDSVRNLATIHDILQLKQLGYKLNLQTDKAIASNLDYYQAQFDRNPDSMRQASAFLLLCYYTINRDDPRAGHIADYLQKQLESNQTRTAKPIDPVFELGEILAALNQFDPYQPITIAATNTLPTIQLTTDSDLVIFQYNWLSKSTKNVANRRYPKQLLGKILKQTDYILADEPVETNYLAVAFESMATLYEPLQPNYSIVESYLANLLIELESHKDAYGLYRFTNGEARIDITGHVLNGLFALLDKPLAHTV